MIEVIHNVFLCGVGRLWWPSEPRQYHLRCYILGCEWLRYQLSLCVCQDRRCEVLDLLHHRQRSPGMLNTPETTTSWIQIATALCVLCPCSYILLLHVVAYNPYIFFFKNNLWWKYVSAPFCSVPRHCINRRQSFHMRGLVRFCLLPKPRRFTKAEKLFSIVHLIPFRG
jgi:hypothetical protein